MKTRLGFVAAVGCVHEAQSAGRDKRAVVRLFGRR